jgi:hypothetical protein
MKVPLYQNVAKFCQNSFSAELENDPKNPIFFATASVDRSSVKIATRNRVARFFSVKLTKTGENIPNNR